MADLLLDCPFCGGRPSQGPTKIEYCQLHGEPFQRHRIWCRKGCADLTGADKERAVKRWNTRAIPAASTLMRGVATAEYEPVAWRVRFPGGKEGWRLTNAPDRYGPEWEKVPLYPGDAVLSPGAATAAEGVWSNVPMPRDIHELAALFANMLPKLVPEMVEMGMVHMSAKINLDAAPEADRRRLAETLAEGLGCRLVDVSEDDAPQESPYAWSSISSVPGTSIVDGGVMLLAETGECVGMVKVLTPRDGAVLNDVARALGTAGDPAKLQRFIRAARRGEEEASERAEIAEAALAALEGKANG